MSALARVERLDARRGAATRYAVRVGWDGYAGVRTYTFDGAGPADFAARLATGATVTVRYPAGRSHRFVIDLPYAAGMVDQFA